MSELPKGWVGSCIGDIADIKLGKMLDKNKNKGEPKPYLRNVNVRWESFNLSDILEMRFTEQELDTFDIRDGDLMVCEGGEPGRCAVWRNGHTALKFQKALMRARFHSKVTSSLACKYLRFLADSGKLQRHFTGTTIKHLPQTAFSKVEISLPPLEEQKRIVAKLDALSARSAHARKDLAHIDTLVTRYKQALLAKAFSGELTKDWRQSRTNETGAIGDIETVFRELRRSAWETIQREKAISKGKKLKGTAWKAKYTEPSPISQPDQELPKGWKFLSIDHLSEFVTDGEHQTPLRTDDGVPLLSARNVQNGHLDLSKIDYVPEQEYNRISRRLVVEVGDVLLSCSGSVGRTCVMPADYICAFVRSVAIIRPLKENGHWISLCLRSDELQEQIRQRQKQTGQPNIFQGAIRELVIPVAPFKEQKEIVRCIESAFRKIDRLAAEAKRALALTDKLDEAILAKAFRGELVPQNPNDEPASMLLERIKAERAVAPKAKKGRRSGS
ncbi:hypothetical protein FMN63_14730 [Stappia sp. BW2]|uniref:restriction endonuclease subunit S n=1 Tax=Stappia sp. BW2 TaxID=2592622 RepID=UPI0011DE881A|nr:restriction endonuclease subunit S [Stappia sp. BW2]TYC67333.1 hypothetical protein FMN63_14730 [Stappia sp. BW2]